MKFVVLLICLAFTARTEDAFRVPLEVTPGQIQSAFIGLEIQVDTTGELTARLPGGGEVRLERMSTPTVGLVANIPGADPEKLALLNDQFSEVTLKRSVGHLNSATYVLGYHRSERDGKA